MHKIAILTSAPSGGGAEIAMNSLADLLAKSGHSILSIFVNSGPDNYRKPINRTLSLERKPESGIFGLISSILKLNNALTNFSPDIILINCDIAEFLILTYFGSGSLVLIEHAENPWITRKLLGKLVRFLLKLRIRAFVKVNQHLSDLRGFTPKLMAKIIIPNLVRDIAIPAYSQNVNEIKRLVFIGRVERLNKRFDWFFDIVLQTTIPGIAIGNGRDLVEFEVLSDQHNNLISFKGFLANPWKELLPGDLLIVPSLHEGDGLVAIEAIANNFPILVADIAPFRLLNLSKFNYANSVEDYVKKIEKSKLDLNSFKVDESIREKIISDRAPERLIEKWNLLFNAIDN